MTRRGRPRVRSTENGVKNKFKSTFKYAYMYMCVNLSVRATDLLSRWAYYLEGRNFASNRREKDEERANK